MYYQPTPIKYEHYHFLVMSAPDERSMKTCVKDLKRNNVKILVRTCGANYAANTILKEGIQFEELNFEDGGVPS